MATYRRAGGRPPVDDERLEIAADGTWRLWRTLGGARVGAFRGRLSTDRRRRLAEALEAARAAPSGSTGARTPSRPQPDGAHETFRAGPRPLAVPAGARVAGEWSRLAGLLRRWSDALTAEPERALELDPGGAAAAPALTRLGSGPVRIWPATLRLDGYARDADGIVMDRASAGAGATSEGARGEPITTNEGWSMRLDMPRALEAPAGGAVEVWAWLDIDGPDGPVRARLVARRPARGGRDRP